MELHTSKAIRLSLALIIFKGENPSKWRPIAVPKEAGDILLELEQVSIRPLVEFCCIHNICPICRKLYVPPLMG